MRDPTRKSELQHELESADKLEHLVKALHCALSDVLENTNIVDVYQRVGRNALIAREFSTQVMPPELDEFKDDFETLMFSQLYTCPKCSSRTLRPPKPFNDLIPVCSACESE